MCYCAVSLDDLHATLHLIICADAAQAEEQYPPHSTYSAVEVSAMVL
jgi:hypothetical protein